jgi:hypothetical protein
VPIPAPPLDKAGGYIIVKYTNGTRVHKLRVHVLAFNDNPTGTYVVPPAGGEASVNATFTALAGFLADFMNVAWTMSLDSYWHVDAVTGAATETFVPVAPAPVNGTSATAATIYEFYECMAMRTTAGHAFRLYIFQRAGGGIGGVQVFNANPAGNDYQKLCAYLIAATTAILGHDGAKPAGSLRVVSGVNRKLRRKAGDA